MNQSHSLRFLRSISNQRGIKLNRYVRIFPCHSYAIRWKTTAAEDKQQSAPIAVKPMDLRLFYRYIRLEDFSDSEIDNIFDQIHNSHDDDNNDNDNDNQQDDESEKATLSQEHFRAFLLSRVKELEQENGWESRQEQPPEEIEQQQRDFAEHEASKMLQLLGTGDTLLTKDAFREIVVSKSSLVDYGRILPIAISMLLVGSSVGIITPMMPFVVQNLGISPGQYGMVVSAFALAKMTGNVPAAILVERHGRKPYLVYTLSFLALGVGGVGLASSFEQLYLCRLMTGLGVAALSTAATMSISDISTPRNRAQTMAPMMSSFAAGMVMGPALGGILADKVGINPTFYLVGVFYLGLTVVNNTLLSETKASPIVFPWQVKPLNKEMNQSTKTIQEAVQEALGQWGTLMSDPRIRNVMIMNGFYWVSLAGSQMTLLPLMLTDANGLNMSATGVGQVYMGMSLVQVLGNPVFARLVDQMGKVPAILTGCSLISASMAGLPLASEPTHLAAALGMWATGSSMLSTAPISYVSDATDENQRAQAIALLRTSGDVGFLLGATAMGALADFTGSLDLAMETSAGALLTATAWFATRNYMNKKLQT